MKQFAAIFILLLLSAKTALAEDINDAHLIGQLSGYFKDYYESIKQDKMPPYEGKLIFDIKHLLEQYGFAEENPMADGIEELQDKINQLLKGNNKGIVLFTLPDSGIINCWLGDLVEEKRETRNIWGKEIGFMVKVIDNLEIRDFAYVLTKGREVLDVGTRGAIICYNLEAYKMRANSIWDFFRDREDDLKNKRYDPSKSNRLRKWLYHKTWHTLAGRQIIAEFLSFIRNEQKNSNPGYEGINIQGKNQTEKINNLYKLSEAEIRAISEYVYEQKRN